MATHIPLDRIIDNPFQPRQTFDKAALQSLADEMKAEGYWNGALQGRRGADGKIELVYGHRRLRALRMLKKESVAIELLDLTDAQMALRSLEENLQREGLTDLEKADAIAQAVQIARVELRANKKNESHAIPEIAKRLGLSLRWTTTQCEISGRLHPKIRRPVQAGYIVAQTAFEAFEWAGDAYVETLAEQGKQAASGADVPKPTIHTVRAMRRTVAALPESLQDNLKADIVTGKITTPQKARESAQRLTTAYIKRQKKAPPDLHAVIVGWTHRVKEWEEQMRAVEPYMDYVEEAPVIAKDFRAALGKLIETAKKLL